jgi:5-methyltetrahydrofolate--homocysteine methyltransferase
VNLLNLIDTQKFVLIDGAMGTELEKRGSEAGIGNITDPDAVLEVHKEYIQCGCHALITNTLTMNRLYIETHGLDIDVRDVNLAGVKLAKQAADGDHLVLGNLSSTGQMLEPYGTYKEETFYNNFREQAEILAEGGIDGFIIETMFDMREAICALKACKDVASSPVILSMSFKTTENGGRTIMGNTAEQCAKMAAEVGADVIGTNCGDLDPLGMADIVSYFRRATDLPIMVEPNAGKPELIRGKTKFNMDPATFTTGILKCIDAGAQLIGGCCGTTPEHICAVSNALKSLK